MDIPGRALATIVVGSAMLGGVLEWSISKRETFKQVTSISEKQENDIVTVVKKRTFADGSSEENTTIVDKTRSQVEAKNSISIEKITPAASWLVYAGINNDRIYSLGLQRRVLGPIYLGAFADTKASYGVSLGVQF